jgi:hypothetical protein
MAERVRVRDITNDEGNRLLRIVRRDSGSVVTWRRAQIVLLSAQGMDVPQIAQVSFTSADRVRDVIHNFNADGFDSLRPKYAGGRPPKFDTGQRAAIKQRPVTDALAYCVVISHDVFGDATFRSTTSKTNGSTSIRSREAGGRPSLRISSRSAGTVPYAR